MVDRMTTRGHFSQLADDLETAHDEIDRLTARVVELENPLNLTDEQKAERLALADRLNRAADNAPAAQIHGDNEIGEQLGLLLRIIAGHIRHNDRLGGMLLRRADKLAALLLQEDTDRG